MFSKVAISLPSGIWASLKKMSLTEFGITTVLLPSGVSMLNAVKDGTGFCWTFACNLGWVKVWLGAGVRTGLGVVITAGLAVGATGRGLT